MEPRGACDGLAARGETRHAIPFGGERDGRPSGDRRRPATALAASLAAFLAWAAAEARAQGQPYLSPTFAASAEGSPYSDVYARAFGSAAPQPPAAAPMQDPAAAHPWGPASGEAAAPEVVYVIEDGRLLTFRAEDYASGNGGALTTSEVPPAEGGHPLAPPQADLSSIADRLYRTPALETAAGPVDQSGPIRLYPPLD